MDPGLHGNRDDGSEDRFFINYSIQKIETDNDEKRFDDYLKKLAESKSDGKP